MEANTHQRPRRALSFGFGGKLITSLKHQVTLHSLEHFASELDTESIQSFSPLLHNPATGVENYERLALDVSTRAYPSSVEDGPIPGSSALLWDCIGALLLSSNKTITFDKRILALLSDDDDNDSSSEAATVSRKPLLPGQTRELEQMLVRGEQEQAVLYAMKHDLWSEALVLSHFLSAASYRRVASEFASRQASSALLRLSFQLFSGRGVEAVMQEDSQVIATCWRRILRLVLANRSPNDVQVIVALGDRLWKDVHCAAAAHVCYLAADCTGKVLLFGGDHLHAIRTAFATPQSVMRTELFFLCKLSQQRKQVEEFQPFRLMFAMWLADLGLVYEAKQWVSAIREFQTPTANAQEEQHGFQEQLNMFESRLYGGRIVTRFQPTASAAAEAPAIKIDFEVPPSPRFAPHSDELPDYKDPAQVAFTSSKMEEFKPTTTTEAASSTSDPFASATKPTVAASSDPFASATKQASSNPFAPNKPRLFTPKRNLFATEQPQPPVSPKAAAPALAAPAAAVVAPAVAAPPTTADTSSSSSWMLGFRGWLTQKLIPMPKNAVAAKTGDKLSAYYDDQAKRWIFPGETAASSAAAGPPPFPPTKPE